MKKAFISEMMESKLAVTSALYIRNLYKFHFSFLHGTLYGPII